MSFEVWAGQVIQSELNRQVEIYDTGRQARMYELGIGAVGAPDVAIECVRSVDPIRTETCHLGPAKEPLSSALTGDWTIIIAPDADIRKIKKGLEPHLRDLEAQGV